MNPSDWNDAQLAGQRIMAGFEGQHLNDDLRHLIDGLKVGGLILFRPNIADPDQVARLCADCQRFAADCGQPPLLIAVDQEGGPVARLRAPFTEFPGNPAMQGLADADHFAAVTARELRTVGINMDMAPVLDVAPPDMSGIMAERVFRGDPAQVARMGCAVIEGLQTRGVIAVAKHFPGIGRTTLDSHHDLPCFTAELADLEAYELPPFQAALARGVAAVMLSHIHYPRLDPRWPASLSPAIARDLLRRRLGFNGVTVTDDLDMGAIARHFDIQTVVAQILAAEIDIVLVCHKGPNIQTAWQAIRDGLHRSADLRRLTLASVSRIAALKTRYLMPA